MGGIKKGKVPSIMQNKINNFASLCAR